MMNRSVFLSLAAGLLASLAFAAPSQASTQAVTTSFAASVGTATDIEITFTGAVSSVVLGPTTPGMTSSFSGDVVTLTFAPSASASADLVVTSAGFGTSPITLSGQTSNFVLSSASVAFTTAAVPEPTSIALLGIGMTGFLAFRRLFKRTAVA
jgi:PEP-CTERM motif